MPMPQKHIDLIQRRIDYLNDRIDKCIGECGYEKAERSALKSALYHCTDESTNSIETKAFKKGQAIILKNYKKYLESIIKDGDLSKIEALLIRTNEWLKDSEEHYL